MVLVVVEVAMVAHPSHKAMAINSERKRVMGIIVGMVLVLELEGMGHSSILVRVCICALTMDSETCFRRLDGNVSKGSRGNDKQMCMYDGREKSLLPQSYTCSTRADCMDHGHARTFEHDNRREGSVI
jgi:hypothetical protein